MIKSLTGNSLEFSSFGLKSSGDNSDSSPHASPSVLDCKTRRKIETLIFEITTKIAELAQDQFEKNPSIGAGAYKFRILIDDMKRLLDLSTNLRRSDSNTSHSPPNRSEIVNISFPTDISQSYIIEEGKPSIYVFLIGTLVHFSDLYRR